MQSILPFKILYERAYVEFKLFRVNFKTKSTEQGTTCHHIK